MRVFFCVLPVTFSYVGDAQSRGVVPLYISKVLGEFLFGSTGRGPGVYFARTISQRQQAGWPMKGVGLETNNGLGTRRKRQTSNVPAVHVNMSDRGNLMSPLHTHTQLR